MKRYLLLPVMLLALTIGGCTTTSVFEGGKSLFATVSNPVGSVDIYRVKNVYAAALELAVKYRKFCYERPYAVLMADPIAKPTCQNRRQIVLALQRADRKAFAAIKAADNFVRKNPRLSAASAIGAAWAAVSDFHNIAREVIVAR